MNIIEKINKEQTRTDFPDFKSGDTIKISIKIKEGEKERVQIYEGVVIARKNSSSNATFTVRKISSGIGVEKIFRLNSPTIDKIEILKFGKVNRSKIYYLRDLKGKAARIKERRIN